MEFIGIGGVLRCPGCDRERPVAEYLARAVPDAVFRFCLACRRASFGATREGAVVAPPVCERCRANKPAGKFILWEPGGFRKGIPPTVSGTCWDCLEPEHKAKKAEGIRAARAERKRLKREARAASGEGRGRGRPMVINGLAVVQVLKPGGPGMTVKELAEALKAGGKVVSVESVRKRAIEMFRSGVLAREPIDPERAGAGWRYAVRPAGQAPATMDPAIDETLREVLTRAALLGAPPLSTAEIVGRCGAQPGSLEEAEILTLLGRGEAAGALRQVPGQGWDLTPEGLRLLGMPQAPPEAPSGPETGPEGAGGGDGLPGDAAGRDGAGEEAGGGS